MAIVNFIPAQDPDVFYGGKELPAQKSPPYTPPTNPNVFYNGYELPQDKVKQAQIVQDFTNYPGLISIGGVYLPIDTLIIINGKKVLAESNILDGVIVYEHILRKPYEIAFEVVVREATAIPGNVNPNVLPTSSDFPQQQINYFWNTIWITNTVQTVMNTYLNGLGITQIIIESINAATVRGSLNIPMKIKAYENQPGETIIIA